MPNLQTILVGAIVLAVFILIIVTAIINHKKGKRSCSCGSACGGCAFSFTCHNKK